MKVKKILSAILNKSANFRAYNFLRKIFLSHKKNEVKKITDPTKPIYYIISYDDLQSCGWTVWERVVLYGAIYAEDHGMIPVVDMQNFKSIYQRKEEFGQVNIWDKYYLQPGGVSLEQALKSNNYVLADTSHEWFRYIRMRKPHKITTEYLCKKYSQYIKLQTNIIEKCENTLASIIPDYNKDTRILALILRGTDYLTHSHPVQPEPSRVVKLAKEIFSKYKCNYYFIGTEDSALYHSLQKDLPTDKVISVNSGIGTNIEGLVGEYISKTRGEEKAAMDYLTTLYILNKSCCLIGGVCGATIVAKYRRNPPYEYINIIDLNEHY